MTARLAVALCLLLLALSCSSAPARKLDELLRKQERVGSAPSPEGEEHGAPIPTVGDADLVFDGNDTLWSFTLGRALSDFADRPLAPGVVDDAAFALARYYASRGFVFAEAQAHLTLEKGGETEPVIRFTIHEGARPKIASVTIMGAASLPKERLEAALAARVHHWYGPSYAVDQDLDDDQDRLTNLYVGTGYIDAKVGRIVTFSEDREWAHVLWTIEEGEHTALEYVEVEGNFAFDSPTLLRATGLRRGVDYYPRRAAELREAIESYYRDRGYAFAKVAVTPEVDRERRSATLRAHVDEGGVWRFGAIGVRGNAVTRDSIVERELERKVKPGEPYSQEAVREAERRLYGLGLFERVTTEVSPSLDERGKADVIVTVAERPAGAFRIGAGYGSWDLLRGNVFGSYDNLFGRGVRVDGRVSAGLRGFDADVGVRDRDLLGTPVRLDLDGYYENRDVKVFTIERQGEIGFLSYPLWDGLRIATGLRVEHSVVTDVSKQAPVEKSSVDLVSTILRLSHDARDDPLDPKWGAYHEISYEEAGIMNLGQADFAKVAAGAAYFATAGPITLALGLRAGFIFPEEGLAPPLQERFFLGGDSSLRGFALNEVGDPAGGNVFALGSLELRYVVYGPFAVALFCDAGNVFARARDIDAAALRVTPGIGLRVKTPIGPLRLDTGFKADRRAGESLAEAYFAVGYPF